MWIVPEEIIPCLISQDDAYSAVEAVFAAMDHNEARNFPVLREVLGQGDALFGFKSGFDREGGILGIKAGGYWPANSARGLTNHQSTVVLVDPGSGQVFALVGGNLLTALRTAAAAAVSVAHLARPESRILGMIGAGHQSAFQMRAVAQRRAFEKVLGWNLHPEMLPRLESTAGELGLPFEAVTLERLGAEADVIVTITSSFAPILMDHHVREGTHVACMGTDTVGKQELDPAILGRAQVFADEVAQSITIGEAQHAVASGLLSPDSITPLGAVINGTHPGRSCPAEITLFDGTGVALQDLAVAARAVETARARGLAVEVA
jgi:ornithine cyclodeaminase/alanine dehydrogenase-like protein (mu-crystallin family)